MNKHDIKVAVFLQILYIYTMLNNKKLNFKIGDNHFKGHAANKIVIWQKKMAESNL